jgi:hypothetical protein
MKAALIGALWGLGHTLTILVVGAAIILFHLTIPTRVGLTMEFAVGFPDETKPFPIPRNPTSNRLLVGRPRRALSIATCAVLSQSSRPASSAGLTPEPGVYGLLTGSMTMGDF